MWADAGGCVTCRHSFGATGTLPAASGNLPLTGSAGTFESTPFPYTFTYSITPQLPGATTSSFSFLCASTSGTNFTIINGAAFGEAPISTLNQWGLLILAILLAAMAVVLLRRRSGRSQPAPGK